MAVMAEPGQALQALPGKMGQVGESLNPCVSISSHCCALLVLVLVLVLVQATAQSTACFVV
jgi:hypothetical protein